MIYKKKEKNKNQKNGETLSSSFFFSWFLSTRFFYSICSSLLRMLMLMLMLMFKMACFHAGQISKQSCSPSLLKVSFVGTFFFFLLIFAIGLLQFELTPISFEDLARF
jgi:hypothetical protein